MKNIYTIYVIICCLLTVNTVAGQATETNETTETTETTETNDSISSKVKGRHEFSFYGMSGMYNLVYKAAGTSSQSDFGGGGGVSYTFNLDEKVGITMGLEFSIYGGEIERERLEGYYSAAFNGSENFRFNYSITGYEERQRTTMIAVPVLLQYKLQLSNSVSFVAAGGAKIGLPVSAKTTAKYGTLTTSGYFDHENVTYTDLPEYGFVTGQTDIENSKRITLKLAGVLTVESGLRFSLSENAGLYTGLFLDYGINSIQKTRAKNMTEYQASSPSQFKHYSVLESNNVEKINFISLGLKIRFAFN
jgi:hypothetical protein